MEDVLCKVFAHLAAEGLRHPPVSPIWLESAVLRGEITSKLKNISFFFGLLFLNASLACISNYKYTNAKL